MAYAFSLKSMELHAQKGISLSADLSPVIFAIMAADQREAIRADGKSVIFDMKILWSPWDLQFEDIHIKVCLWHATTDNLAPAMLAHYIAEHLLNCETTFYPNEGHTDPLTKHIYEILTLVIRASQAV